MTELCPSKGGHVILSPFCGQRRGGRGCEKRGHPLAYFPHHGVPVGLAPTSSHLVPLSQEQVASPPGTQLLHVARRWRAGDIGSPNRLCSRGPSSRPGGGRAAGQGRRGWGGLLSQEPARPRPTLGYWGAHVCTSEAIVGAPAHPPHPTPHRNVG